MRFKPKPLDFGLKNGLWQEKKLHVAKQNKSN